LKEREREKARERKRVREKESGRDNGGRTGRVGPNLVDHPERSFSKAKFRAESENDIENVITIPPRVVSLSFSK